MNERSKIDRESAETEFDRFASFARIDMDKPRDENDRKDIRLSRDTFIYHVMQGTVTVDEEGHPTIKTGSESLPEVTFTNRPKVTALRAMDKCKKDNDVAKMLANMGRTLRIAPGRFDDLDQVDMEVVTDVFGLFLG